VLDVGVAQLAQPAVDEHGDRVRAGRPDPPGERVPVAGAHGDLAQVRPPPVPLTGQRAVDAGRGDLEGVRAAEQVLVAVQLVGGGAGDPGDVVQSDPVVGIHHDRHALSTPGGPHVEPFQVETRGRHDRFQHAVQAPGCRPGGLLGAEGGHRGLLIFSHPAAERGIRRPTAWVCQGIAPLSGGRLAG
jgi:hypothetical protein